MVDDDENRLICIYVYYQVAFVRFDGLLIDVLGGTFKGGRWNEIEQLFKSRGQPVSRDDDESKKTFVM